METSAPPIDRDQPRIDALKREAHARQMSIIVGNGRTYFELWSIANPADPQPVMRFNTLDDLADFWAKYTGEAE